MNRTTFETYFTQPKHQRDLWCCFLHEFLHSFLTSNLDQESRRNSKCLLQTFTTPLKCFIKFMEVGFATHRSKRPWLLLQNSNLHSILYLFKLPWYKKFTSNISKAASNSPASSVPLKIWNHSKLGALYVSSQSRTLGLPMALPRNSALPTWKTEEIKRERPSFLLKWGAISKTICSLES